MKERTAIDTASHPSYMSQPVSVPVLNGGVVPLNSSTTGASYGATLTYSAPVVTITGVNGELGILLTGLVPGLPVTAKVKITHLADPALLSARDSADAVQLGSTAVSSIPAYWWSVTFIPTTSTQVRIGGIWTLPM